MSSDAEIALAFIARRQGTATMAASAWAHVMSLELGWMAPGAARTFIEASEASGLVVPKGDGLALGFDHTKVVVPRGFRPRGDMTAEPPSTPSVPLVPSAPSTPSQAPDATPSAPKDMFPALVARIAAERSMDKGEVMDEVAAVQERFGGRLSADAAVVRVAMAHGVDASAAAAEALARITSG